MAVDHVIKPQLCESCGTLLNRAANAEQGTESKPSKGDFTVCLGCGAPGIYGADLSIRPMTMAEFDAMAPHEKRELAVATAKVQLFRTVFSATRPAKPDA